MPESWPRVDEEQVTDGRRRRGNQRRRALLDATLRVIGRDGLAAVTQRTVAAEAGLEISQIVQRVAGKLVMTRPSRTPPTPCGAWTCSPPTG
jgi:hypothetical protein